LPLAFLDVIDDVYKKSNKVFPISQKPNFEGFMPLPYKTFPVFVDKLIFPFHRERVMIGRACASCIFGSAGLLAAIVAQPKHKVTIFLVQHRI
jgi:hypothetical protein